MLSVARHGATRRVGSILLYLTPADMLAWLCAEPDAPITVWQCADLPADAASDLAKTLTGYRASGWCYVLVPYQDVRRSHRGWRREALAPLPVEHWLRGSASRWVAAANLSVSRWDTGSYVGLLAAAGPPCP